MPKTAKGSRRGKRWQGVELAKRRPPSDQLFRAKMQNTWGGGRGFGSCFQKQHGRRHTYRKRSEKKHPLVTFFKRRAQSVFGLRVYIRSATVAGGRWQACQILKGHLKKAVRSPRKHPKNHQTRREYLLVKLTLCVILNDFTLKKPQERGFLLRNAFSTISLR